MAYCCVASELLYIILFLLAETQSESVIEVLLTGLKHGYLSFPVAIALFGWGIKQAINVIQMKTAADSCAADSCHSTSHYVNSFIRTLHILLFLCVHINPY